MEKIHLVTTSNIEAWSKTKKNILLGGWCYNYLDKAKYKNYSFEIIQSPSAVIWGKKNIEIVKKGRKQIDQTLFCLILYLNKHHKSEYSSKYWSIILLPWLNNFVEFYYILEQRLKFISINYKIDSVSFVYSNKDSILPNSYNEGIKFLGRESFYFHKLVYEIFNHFNFKDVKINFIKKKKDLKKNNNSELRDFEKSDFKGKIRDVILKIFDKLPILENRPFIIGSALPYLEDSLLKISNFQFPKNIRFTEIEKIKIQNSKRNENYNLLDKKLINKLNMNFFLFELIYRYLPTCYLEGYETNKKKMTIQKWPKNPKYIFTSINHYFDEIFKFYTAEKVEEGIPYYLGQHGNGYCTFRYFGKLTEVYTSDRFLVWGRSGISKNSVKLFNFRKPKNKKKTKFSKSGILLVKKSAEDITSLFSPLYDYQNEKFIFLSNFVKSLNDKLRNQITVRLYHDDTNNFCFEEKKWKELDPLINLDLRHQSLRTMISNSRILVFGYDSTGFLEAVSQNIPVLLYFHEKNFEKMLNNEVIEDFLKLKKAKVLFNDPKELADHITNIWQDINYWWESKITVDSISHFRDKYCATVKNPIMTLNKFLK